MSFSMDEYLKLRQKRLDQAKKESARKNAKKTSARVSDTDSFMEEYLSLRQERLANKKSDAIAPVRTTTTNSSKNVAPMKNEEEDEGFDFFQKGVFDDGYQFGDVTKAILGTATDVGVGVVKGAAKTVGGVLDAGAYGVAGIADYMGADDFADELRVKARENVIDNALNGTDDWLNQYSLLGRTSDAVAEGLGQVASVILTGGAVGGGAVGATLATTGLMGVSSFGSGMTEAYEMGATDEEAATYGLIKGVVDAGSEMIFGGLGKTVKALGISKGLTSLDDVFAQKLASKITNQTAKNFVEFGVKASAEGVEEVLAGIGSAVGKKLTFMEEKELRELIEDENLLEQFVVGAVTSGISQSGIVPGMRHGSLVETTAKGQDFISGMTENDQKVVDRLVEQQIAEKETDGKKLSKKEKNEVYDDIIESLERGEISLDTIAEVIDGDSYKAYKDMVAEEEKAMQEIAELYKGDELQTELANFMEHAESQKVRSELDEKVFGLVKNGKLAESYYERGRRGQSYQADLSKYDEKQKATIQNAINSGILNNTRRTHEFVDLIAKISADKGVLFDFTSNEKLKGSIYAVGEGKTVNGFVTESGVTLNINSAKALNSVVGHEITHVLEGTELYNELQSALFEYAKSRKATDSNFDSEYKERLYNTRQLYKTVEGYQGVDGFNKIKNEVVADLVGDYLFTDADFVNHLVKNRNVFQKIWDEIKYLHSIAKAGSKEEKQLLEVKRAFEKAYRESGKQNATTENFDESDTKYSISVADKDTIDFLENQEHITTYKAMQVIDGKLYPPMAAKVKDENGRYQLTNPSQLGVWQQATEDPTNIKKIKNGVGYYTLNKGDGTSIDAAYNPYEHSSNLVLNDQFESAHRRDNLVVVECVIPVSEMSSGYKAEYAKDSTGVMDWKSGVVAGKIKDNKRQVYLSRYLKPVRILSDAEVATKYKEILDGTGVSVPFNVVQPSLLAELEKVGVDIDYEGSPMYKANQKRRLEKEAAKYLDTKDIQYSLSAEPTHRKSLEKNYSVNDASLELPTIMERYDKILDIWKRLGSELNSKFLEDWNNKSERPFTIFKAQAGYKYNVELSSMCKKGVPLFEAIDTIVKKEVMKELDTDVLGKEEKEILYDILKKHNFEIPCAICYVEQARQREGVIIDAFLNGKTDTNAKGEVSGVKLGWNQVLDSIQKEMKANGVDHNFAYVSRDIATDKYDPADLSMDEKTYAAFAEAIKKIANQEIVRYNKESGKNRKLLKDVTPEAVKECFKGTLPSNLKIFKVLLTEPSSRFKIQNDLLYSSMTTKNLTMAHNGLYSLFNSQGGVSGYKTKQAPTVYWGEILGKKWKPEATRKEGGVRNQSNSDFQMFTLLDQAQMYMDFSAKGYYLQAYTKVLSELKLFGLSKSKINASLIPNVVVYRNADGTVDVERTMENAGLDENGNPVYDDIEGINHKEAFMLLEDPEYSKNIGGICIGYSDNHIRKLLDDDRVQLIIGFHDKTNDPNKRYRGARYAKNYNGLNEAVKTNADGTTKTVHIGFNPYVKKAEQKFKYNKDTEAFEGTVNYNGKTYTADDIPRLATDLYLEMCAKKGYTPAYNDFAGHRNYYKLLADFSLYDSQGHYAPHRKVAYDMPDSVPYLDADGNKQYMPTEEYIKIELQKELAVRDAIAEAMADTSEDGIIPQFKAEVNRRKQMSLSKESEAPIRRSNFDVFGEDIKLESAPVQEEVVSEVETATESVPVDIAPAGEDDAPISEEIVEDVAPTGDVEDTAPVDVANSAVLNRLNKKLSNSNEELAKNEKLRAESAKSYDEKIAKAQAELDAKKNKDTKVANAIKRRIERLKRLKADRDAEYAKKIGDIKARVVKAEASIGKYHPGQDRAEKTIARIDKMLEHDKSVLIEEYEQSREQLKDKDSYISGKASELYNEIRNLKKGVRASELLGELLDSGHEWSAIRSALVNIKHTPGELVNQESSIESIAREMLNEDYENRMLDLEEDYASRVKKLEDDARVKRKNATVAHQRMTKQQEYEYWAANLVGDTTTWVDKKMGISYRVNTLKRNLRDIVRDANGNRDIAKADAIDDATHGEYNRNEAKLNREENRIKNPYAEKKITEAEDAYIQMLGEFRHNPDTTLTEDVVKDFYEKNKKNIDEKKVDEVIKMARQTYDELLVRVNEVLREQGMKEIPYRKGYFPHFTEEEQGLLAKLFNWKTHNNDIPTDIAGLTEQFNPNRSWQSFNKQRKGDTTDYSFMKGMDTYVHGALDWIYHIEDIQKRRAIENHIRYIHSEKGVQEKIDAIRSNEEYDADEAQEQIDLVLREAGNPLNNFVTDFRAGTNTLANKKSSLDRGVEELTNRKFYSTMTNISNRVSANMVGGSISSALTNFIPITQSWGEVSPISSLRAMGDTIRSTFRDDGVVNKSDFLTNRLNRADNLYKTNWDKVSDKVGLMMEVVDNFTSQTVWRSRYLENISNGMSEAEAIRNADQFAEGVMAGRSRGNQPTIFDSKNPLVKTLTAFQLEVANQYGYMFKDMPQDMKSKSMAKLVSGYAKMFIGAYAYNALYSSLTGRDAAFDPIGIIKELLRDMGLFGEDDEEEPTDIVMNLANNILNEVPFVGGLMGGGRVPISSAIPYDGNVVDIVEGASKLLLEGDTSDLTSEWLKPFWYVAMPMGGGQIKKSIQGLSMFSDDHPVAGSYTNSGNLRFPVEDTLLNRVQAGLFGQYASKNAREYFDNGWSPLNKKQIQEYQDLDLPIADYRAYKSGLSEAGATTDANGYAKYTDELGKVYWYDKATQTVYDSNYKESNISVLDLEKVNATEQKVEYISDLPISDSQKNILYNSVVSQTTTDKYGYEKYTGLEYNENDKLVEKTYWYDRKRNVLYNEDYEKVSVNKLGDLAPVVKRDMSNYDDFSTYEEFDFATKNPEKYAFMQENNISYKAYAASDDSKDAYNWAYNNPEKYTLSKAICNDVVKYKKYTKDLYDIRADKDSNGDSIIGTAKRKKVDYINGLDLEYGEKLILFRSLYESDDTYNEEIIQYLNDRDDITYQERVTILKELGFEVSADGTTVYW